MTKQATFHLSSESLGVLRSLKGKTWRLTTGKPSPEKSGHHFSWDNVILATDGGDARIHTELVESEFEGYGEEYAQLSVHSDSQGLAEAQRDGRASFEHAGARITEVFLIRISTTQMMYGESTWTYSGDYGVIFGLTEGAAAVCKTVHHTDALDVFFADSVEELEIDDRFDEWNVADTARVVTAVPVDVSPLTSIGRRFSRRLAARWRRRRPRRRSRCHAGAVQRCCAASH